MLADRVRMGSGGDNVLNIETVLDNFTILRSSAQDSMWGGKPAIYMTSQGKIQIKPNPKALKYNRARITLYHSTIRTVTATLLYFYPSSGGSKSIPFTESLDDEVGKTGGYWFPSESSGVLVFYLDFTDYPDRIFSISKEGSGGGQTTMYVTDVEYFNI